MIRSILTIVALTWVISSFAQTVTPARGYYMVVAAYKQSGDGYAQRFSTSVQQKGVNAEYAYFPAKNMIFVYTKYYTDFDEAVADIYPTRKATSVPDAWVYINKEGPVMTTQQSGENQEIPHEENIDSVVAETEELTDSTILVELKVDTKEEVEPAMEESVEDNSRLIYFQALDARTQNPVDVRISFKDAISGRLIDEMGADQTKRIDPPSNVDGTVQVSVNTFGWVADAVYFDFDEPINDSTDYFLKEQGDTLVVFFDLHRMRRGDVQVLYNVYFIPDASLMRPVSEAQLKELLAMLTEDESLKIKLHGHTNGSSRGEYYRLNDNDTIFFALNRQHEKTNGSAKQLSYDRANTVRRYLIHNGITEDRLQVEGWGGKRMIYDKMSKAATRNIRVEVEVLED